MRAAGERGEAFFERFCLRLPILLAPLAGIRAPALSVAVANAGGLASWRVPVMQPDELTAWPGGVRANTNGAFQPTTWIPAPPPARDRGHGALWRDFLAGWGPPVPPEAGEATLPEFSAQCEAMLTAAPPV